MKRCWLMLGILLCCFAASACGKKQAKEEKKQEEYGREKCPYEYSYQEQKDGTILFSISGDWENGYSWKAESILEEIVSVEEKSQEAAKAVFLLRPCADGGYSQVDFVLDAASEEKQQYVISVLAILDGDSRMEVSDITYYAVEAQEMEGTKKNTDKTS